MSNPNGGCRPAESKGIPIENYNVISGFLKYRFPFTVIWVTRATTGGNVESDLARHPGAAIDRQMTHPNFCRLFESLNLVGDKGRKE